MLFDNNPLSIVCSLICNHEKQCEGHCIQGRKGMPVHTSSIENYISEAYLDKMHLTREESKGQRVAIVGSGPAGITIAVNLARKGYDITLFDSRDRIGGVMRYGIPAFRLPKSILDRYQKQLQRLGIKIRPNTTIGGALTVDALFRDGYKAIFIGTGVWRPRTLGVKGESLGNVHFAIDYLANPDVYELGDRVAIIGAGNSAMDVARTVIRHGSRYVTVYARGQHVDAASLEADYAAADGVDFQYNLSVVEVTPEGPVLQKALLDEAGQVTGYEEPRLYPADSTLIAVSQGPKDKIVNTTKGIATTKNGLIATDENGQTTREGIFASGDVVNGAKTVVEAVKYSKLVAEAMDEYLTSLRESVQF